MDSYSRRRFLRALAAGGALYAFGRTPGTVVAQAAGVGGFADYKALVCVYLVGGNDSWSMVVPRSQAEYDTYARSRQNLALARDALLPINPVGEAAGSYGLHPSVAGLRDLFESGRCAVVANVGPLLAPTTKPEFQAKSVPLPPQLFSHNDQEGQWLSLRGRKVESTGWAGRIADSMSPDLAGQSISLNVSLSGQTLFQAGRTATPYVMGRSGPTRFQNLGTGARAAAFRDIAAASYDSPYERAFAESQRRALRHADAVSDALAAVPSMATSFPASPLGEQLQTVARMIAVRERLGMSRQIFFVATGGFDTHDDQLENQPGLLGNVSASLAAFHAATVELGVASSVTTFTQSDFGRTLTSNGDGSDHGWGGLQLVIGDAVRGRSFYGRYPVLEIGGADDLGGGRMIPTVSADQYVATLARWFGVPEEKLPLIAPNVDNFASRDLGFMI